MIKLAIWTLTVIGLIPSVFVALAALFVLRNVLNQPAIARYRPEGFIHDSYFMLGNIRLEFTPQYWASTVLLLGVIMILIGLAAMLRS